MRSLLTSWVTYTKPVASDRIRPSTTARCCSAPPRSNARRSTSRIWSAMARTLPRRRYRRRSMAIVLGLLVALFYGCGDFFGGLAAKRTPAITVVLGSFALSATLVALVLGGWHLVGDAPTPTAADVWLGVAVGLTGPVAVGLLYRGLAMGRMSVVAPITAVVAAIVPLVWALLDGE